MQKAAQQIVQILRRHGYEALYAGGWVRDFLLRRRSDDIDIATSARPEEILRLFPNSMPIGVAFGVVQVRRYGHAYDVSTFRKEGPYLDGRHPSSVAFTGAEQDARRRDFTVNGLFYDPTENRVIDYVGGRADLESRVLRTIGKAEDRFTEDKLRILRAVRLACSLDFKIEPATWSAIRRFASEITQVSSERIRDELLKVLTGPDPARGLRLMHESGLLGHFLPEVESLAAAPGDSGSDPLSRTRDALGLLTRRSAPLSLAVLLHSVGGSGPAEAAKVARQVCRRLRLSNDETDRVVSLVANQNRLTILKDMRESAARRTLLNPDIEDQLELQRVTSLAAGGNLETYRFAKRKLRAVKGAPTRPTRLITGNDLLELGYAPGPLFREILESVEDLVMENVLRTRAEAIEHIRRQYPRNGANARKGEGP